MTKTKVTVLLEGQQLPPYVLDEETLERTTLGQFLENMPYQGRMLIDVIGDNRVSINGREIEVDDWYTTYLGGEEIFVAILSGGVIAGNGCY